LLNKKRGKYIEKTQYLIKQENIEEDISTNSKLQLESTDGN